MKKHYAALDGLRGLAAIAVMMMHEMGIFRPGNGPTIHAFVAVDLFFMLSGFVLALSYDRPLDAGMKWRAFMTIRVIRLYPMLFLAVGLGGALAALKLAFQGTTDPGESLWLLPCGFLLLPVGLLFGELTNFTSTASLVPFGGPAWSLLFEFVASAAFATALRRPARWGIPVFLLAGVALIGLTFAAGGIGTLGVQGYIGVPAGLLRVGIPFAIGIFLLRKDMSRYVPVLPAAVGMLLGAVACSLPIGQSPGYDLLCVFVLFPLILTLCARASASEGIKRLCGFLGNLSYPLYLLHVPVSRMAGFALKKGLPETGAGTLVVAGSIASVLVSIAALALYDQPVRAALTSALRRKRSAA